MQKRTLKEYFSLTMKGIGMGAANVIPGVSGGTIALITGIFEELIDSIKSFDLEAIQLLFKGKFKAFSNHVNLGFLVAVFFGVAISILSIAKLLEYLFANYPVYVWAFFFGLVLSSVYFVGRSIFKWTSSVIVLLIFGTGIAIAISILNPASENDSFIYLMLCGAIAVCSMILPGLSGSFVLILLGNYELVMIRAVSNLQFEILLPVILGAGIGIILFSHFLSWVFKKFRDQTIAVLTGFIFGSLAILWPWKNTIYKMDSLGNILQKSDGELVIARYERVMPDAINQEVILAIVFMIAGIFSIWLLEKYAGSISKESDA